MRQLDDEPTLIDPFGREQPAEFVTAEPERSSALVVVMVLGVLAVIGALVFAGGDDAPDEPIVEDEPSAEEILDRPATTDDVNDAFGPDEFNIVVGGELDLREVPTVLPGAVFGAHEVAGSLFTLVVDDRPFGVWSTVTSDLTMHVRRPDGEWIDLGPVLDGAAIYATTASPDAFLAVGLAADGAPTIWSTTDGTDWTAEILPTADGENPIPAQVSATADTVLVRGAPLDPWSAFVQDLSDAGLELGPFGPEFVEDGSLVVRGPMGIPVDEVDLNALGIENPFEGPLPFDENAGTVWVGDGDGWTTIDEPFWDVAGGPGGLFTTEAGRFLRLTGSTIEWSDDARTWEPAAQGLGVWRAVPWGDRVVTFSSPNGFQIRRSDLRIDAQGPLPTSGFVGPMSAGSSGLAYVAQTDDGPPAAASDVVIRRDGVEAHFQTNRRILLEADGVEIAHWWIDDLRLGDGKTVVDREAGLVFFLDPESGEPRLTAGFDELEQIEAALRPIGEPGLRLLFSPDARTWTSNRLVLASPLDPFASAQPHVGTDTLVVFTRDVDADEPATVILEATLDRDG